MNKCLVCLVGDQTVPNIIVTAQLKPDFLLLVTSSAMEKKGKSKAILDTLAARGLDYSNRHHKIEILQDSIIDLQSKISSWLGSSEEEYDFTVNLTGGTKLMSIAAYDLFTDFGSEMLYVPIPRNEYLTPFPKRRPRDPIPLHERLNVNEYLTAYGFDIMNRKHLENGAVGAESRQDLTLFCFDHYLDLRPLLRWLGNHLRSIKAGKFKRGYAFAEQFEIANKAQKRFLDDLGFELQESQVSKKILEPDRDYIRGGWLEERLFLALRKASPPGVDVQINVQCQDPQGNRNEFDILFTFNNALYLVECKSLGAAEGGEDEVGGTINDFLYKLGALRQNFGLTPRAFLATTAESILDDMGSVKQHLDERARQFGTRIIPLLHTQDLEGYFEQEVFSGA